MGWGRLSPVACTAASITAPMPRLLAFFLLFALVPPVLAQEADTTALVRIELADGSVFVGTIVSETADEVVLRTQGGAEVTIPVAQIRRRAPFEGRVRAGRVVADDPNRTRLLFSPTARPLGRGQGYVAVYELVIPFVAVGITDAVSVSGGTILLPEAFGRVLYVAPKVTVVNQERLAVALGGIGLGVFVDGESGSAGIGYGLATYGGPERAVTFGAGVAFAEGEIASGAVLTVGGEAQVSGSIKLISENYVIPYRSEVYICPNGGHCTADEETSYEVLLSAGVRFFGERLAADFALWTSPGAIGEDIFPFIPWVGFAYNFGR